MNRREFLKSLLLGSGSALLSGSLGLDAFAMGEHSQFHFTFLKLGKSWDCRFSSALGLLYEINLRTNVKVSFKVKSVRINDEALFENPLIFLTGTTSFPIPSEKELKRLSSFLQYGGMLVIDSATAKQGDEFDKSARELIKKLLPEKKLIKLPLSNTLFKSFYRIRRVAGRYEKYDFFEGVIIEDRTAIVYSMNDLLGAFMLTKAGRWAFTPVLRGEMQRQLALAIGTNIVMYALTVNYKSDQIHLLYNLRRYRY